MFEAASAQGAEVIRHFPNRGKGYALKRGFAYIEHTYPGHDVVCADCDGQHTTYDILRVAEALTGPDHQVVLGSRGLDRDVPARSRFGNALTRRLFHLTTRVDLQDTQTGLRAYSNGLLPWLQQVGGQRFEYELAVLLAAHRAGHKLNEVPIATIYLNGNESSHFRPVRDWVRIYARFLNSALRRPR